MNINVGDVLEMKKNHPCGCNRFLVLRSGMDFKLRCEGCGREFMVPRSKIEKIFFIRQTLYSLSFNTPFNKVFIKENNVYDEKYLNTLVCTIRHN